VNKEMKIEIIEGIENIVMSGTSPLGTQRKIQEKNQNKI